jgi:hypothetical protein
MMIFIIIVIILGEIVGITHLKNLDRILDYVPDYATRTSKLLPSYLGYLGM